jgi:hypothetical protein
MKIRFLVSFVFAIAVVIFFVIALDQDANDKTASGSFRGRLAYAIGLPADLVGRHIPIGHINTTLVVAFLLFLIIFYSLVFFGLLTGLSWLAQKQIQRRARKIPLPTGEGGRRPGEGYHK